MTFCPRLAKHNAFSHVPNPESRTEPVIWSVTVRIARCSLPIAQRGFPTYRFSKLLRSCTGMVTLVVGWHQADDRKTVQTVGCGCRW
jgi:hypothetical protein